MVIKMDKKELKEYLRDNLRVMVYINDGDLQVDITLEDETIASASTCMPFENAHYDEYGNRA